MSGVFWYVGVSQSGKTTLALKHVAEDIERTGNPALIVDATQAKNLRQEYHAKTIDEVIDRVWGQGLTTAYTPEDLEDFDRLVSAAKAGKNIIFFLDEAFHFCSGRSISRSLSIALRTHAHSGSIYRLTTQHIGDIATEATAATTGVFVFRVNSDRGLERVELEGWGDPEKIQTLEQGEHIYTKIGF